MLSVHATEGELSSWIELGPELAVAAVNSPSSCVLAGTRERIADVQQRCQQRNIATQRLRVRHAFHSADVDSIIPDLRAAFKTLRPAAQRIPWISNVTGSWHSWTNGLGPDPDYWMLHAQSPVLFARGSQLLTSVTDFVLEIGPHPVLLPLAMSPREPTSDGNSSRSRYSMNSRYWNS